MTNRFMMSVAAAALIAGTGFAHAQGTGMSREGASGGSTAHQSQSAPSSDRAGPSSSTTQMNRSDDSQGSAAKTTQSDEKMQPQGSKNQRAQDDMKAGQKSEKSAQDNNMKGEKSKSTSSESDNARGSMSKTGMSKDGMNNAQSRPSASTQTTGNAATSATAAPPPEKQTQIASAIKSERIEEVNSVNFELNVGARVPTSVRFYPLPPRIVEIYPEWRGYEVIRVRGRYVIVRPQTHEIVYIIEG